MVPDLAGLVRALNRGEVRFVVIGGIAVAAHGYVRATEDLDIVDIVQRVPALPGWKALASEAETTTLSSEPVVVCSRAHLLAMKRARHTLQDQADIEALDRPNWPRGS